MKFCFLLDMLWFIYYNAFVIKVEATDIFETWFASLRDMKTKVVIDMHIDCIRQGNLGIVRPLGEGLFEKKIQYGPGLRLYFANRGEDWIILLAGGDKGSQRADIKKAKQIKNEVS